MLPFKLHENAVFSILREKDKKKRLGMLKKFQDNLQEIINGADKLYGEYHTEYATEVLYRVAVLIKYFIKMATLIIVFNNFVDV